MGQTRRIDCVRGESASPSIAATAERFARKSLDPPFGGPIHASSGLHLCVPPQSGQRERIARGRLESNTHSAFRPVETGSRVRGHLIRISVTLDLPLRCSNLPTSRRERTRGQLLPKLDQSSCFLLERGNRNESVQTPRSESSQNHGPVHNLLAVQCHMGRFIDHFV